MTNPCRKFGVIGSGILMGVLLLTAVPMMLFGSDHFVGQGTIPVAKHLPDSAYAKMAKVSYADAVQKALANKNGTPIKADLDDENGFLVWKIDIATNEGAVYEVIVDAGNGQILASHVDND